MKEIPPSSAEQYDQPNTLDLVERYCTTISSSTNPSKIGSVLGLLDDEFHHNTPELSSSEYYTYYTLNALEDLLESPDANSADRLQKTRMWALRHVVRSAVQGNKVPVELFEPIVEQVRAGMATVQARDSEWSNSSADKVLRTEVRDTFYSGMDNTTRLRANYMLGLLEKPRPRVVRWMLRDAK